MSIDKRLISTEAAVCTTDTLDIFGDSSCVALYGLNYDGSDASGNYNGTPTDVTFNAPGYIDYAASFNGSTSNVDIGSFGSTFQQNFTVSLWFNLNSFSAFANLFSAQNDYYVYMMARYDISKVRAAIEVSPSTSYIIDSGTISTNTWYNAVMTVSSTDGFKFYMNNVLQGTQAAATGGLRTMSGKSFIGAYQSGATFEYPLDGKIDQVRIFNKALSSSEVTTLYGEVACEYTCTTDTNGFPASASSNLVAYYKLDNDATDETGTYNGTETSITYDGGRYGSAAVFNGSSSVINTSYTPTVANLRTVSFWFKTNATTFAVMQSVGPYGVGSGYTWEWVYILADGRITGGYGANNGGAVYQKATTESFNDDNWHHLALTLNGVYGTGSSVKLYIDGVEPSTTTDTTWNTSISTIQGTFTLGALKEYSSTNYYYTGELDQVRIFNKELSSTEVSAIYEEEHQCYITVDSTDPFGDSSNIALYEFENNANDSIGSYNGTVTGTVSYSTDSVIGAYSVEFSSGHINTGHNFNLANNSFSFSFWFANSATGSTNSYVISTDGPQTQNNHLLIGRRDSNGKLNFAFYANDLDSATSVSTDGTWQHWVCTYDASTNAKKIYLNGSLDASGTASADYQGTGNVEFGFGIYQAYGKLDQVRIFDRVLNGDEVWKLYAEGAKG